MCCSPPPAGGRRPRPDHPRHPEFRPYESVEFAVDTDTFVGHIPLPSEAQDGRTAAVEVVQLEAALTL